MWRHAGTDRLQDQLHGVYTTLASLANPDETAPEADWVLRVAIVRAVKRGQTPWPSVS